MTQQKLDTSKKIANIMHNANEVNWQEIRCSRCNALLCKALPGSMVQVKCMKRGRGHACNTITVASA